ncbi:MAG TPA: NAD(P)/FAD-dependent oxidoreductase [Longimicrobiales bacterium]|nr:NAD(P)/FAD-dependent oxidoreductase [Longimicrobiales bacterium]
MEEYDVVIAGAGLAGLVAAEGLASGGWRVLLVDARSAVDSRVHTTGIFVRRTLEDFPLPEDCLGPGIRRVVLRSPAGRHATLVSEVDEFRVGEMRRLYRCLLARARARGAEYRAATRYQGSEAISGGSSVCLERHGRRSRVAARVIIGADGAGSRVARDLGLDENREWIVGVEDVLEGSLQRGEPELHCIVDPRLAPGYIAWVADDGKSVHVGVGGRPDGFRPAAALAELHARLEAYPCFSGLGRLRRAERRGGRIPINGVLPRIGCARGLLIGDAAGAVSPLTAGGLDPCYRLTGLAMAMVARVLEGAPPELLERYSGAPFQRHFARRRRSRRLFEALGHPLLVELAFGGLRTPPGRRLARRVLFGRGSFPDVDPAHPMAR